VTILAAGDLWGKFRPDNARPFKRYRSLATPQRNSLVKVNADVAWLILKLPLLSKPEDGDQQAIA
jgi:hypothetical protein